MSQDQDGRHQRHASRGYAPNTQPGVHVSSLPAHQHGRLKISVTSNESQPHTKAHQQEENNEMG